MSRSLCLLAFALAFFPGSGAARRVHNQPEVNGQPEPVGKVDMHADIGLIEGPLEASRTKDADNTISVTPEIRQPEHSKASDKNDTRPMSQTLDRVQSAPGVPELSNVSSQQPAPIESVRQAMTTKGDLKSPSTPRVGLGPQLHAEVRHTSPQTNGSASGPLHRRAIMNERVLMLVSIVGVGKLLSARFSDKEASALKKMLLQCIIPASLLKSLSKTRIDIGLMAYIVGGVFLVLARLVGGTIASYAVQGTEAMPNEERAKLHRTAIFELSTTASALSVLPFLYEFLGMEYVGLAGIVDLPMKLYMLLLMPWLLSRFGSEGGSCDVGQGRRYLEVASLLMKDPITLSLVFGIALGVATDGGTDALGFIGQAVDLVVGAQTPVLFFLIGLKLKCDFFTPFASVVYLLAIHGILLIMVWLVIFISAPSERAAQFLILLSQGAPSVVGTGVIHGAAKAGVQGYSTDFAYDIVRVAFPISAFLQCCAGLTGILYQDALGTIGLGLLVLAVLIRVALRGYFKQTKAGPA